MNCPHNNIIEGINSLLIKSVPAGSTIGFVNVSLKFFLRNKVIYTCLKPNAYEYI